VEIGIPAGLRQHLREVFGEKFRIGLIGFELNKRPQFRLADAYVARREAPDLPHNKAEPAEFCADPKTLRNQCPLNHDLPHYAGGPPGQGNAGRKCLWLSCP